MYVNDMPALYDDPFLLAPPRTVLTPRSDGTFVLASPEPLRPYARCVGEWIEHWSRETPDAIALAERDAKGEWRKVGWGELRVAIGKIAQSLLGLQLPARAPVVILSDNGIDHALLMLAAMHVGRPVSSVSSAYSRLTRDYGKPKGMLATLKPALVYASDAAVYGPALAACAANAVTVVGQGADTLPGALRFESLLDTTEGPQVMQAFARILPDDHAKYLLTSGSTGHPKAVINTHRMLCANQQMMAQVWPFLEREKPVIVDWLPWSHTFGGNHNLHMVLRNGGTLYVDEGRPAPGLVEKTVRNLREVRPNLMFNVPRGYDMLLPFLEADDEVARGVLGDLRCLFYAAAALPPSTWTRLATVARRVRAEPLWMTTSWGATETAPAVTTAHFRLEGAGSLGIPLPGVEVKFVPNADKLELRVRGVSVFPGYLDAPELTAAAFDPEGYYRIGDAGFLADADHPERGIVFNGRVAEDFKLTSGTWVSVGTLRVKLLSAFAPYVQDAVLTGHGREEMCAMLFPSPACKALSAEALASRLREALAVLRAEGAGSSQCPARLLVLDEPANADAGEITDKGYVNQRAVLERRAADVELLYAQPAHPRVIRIP
jgi:feruloyl-CoA synthase